MFGAERRKDGGEFSFLATQLGPHPDPSPFGRGRLLIYKFLAHCEIDKIDKIHWVDLDLHMSTSLVNQVNPLKLPSLFEKIPITSNANATLLLAQTSFKIAERRRVVI